MRESASPSSDLRAEWIEDVEVLADEGVGLGRAAPLQLGQGFRVAASHALVEPGLQVQDLLVEAGDADLARASPARSAR